MYHPSIHIDYTHFRYASRCLMMEFSPPALSLGLTDYMELGGMYHLHGLLCVLGVEVFFLMASEKWIKQYSHILLL